MVDNDVWDKMPNIDGKVHGRTIHISDVDEETWEINSAAYSVSYDSNDDDVSNFINDGSTDYETTSDDDSEDEL